LFLQDLFLNFTAQNTEDLHISEPSARACSFTWPTGRRPVTKPPTYILLDGNPRNFGEDHQLRESGSLWCIPIFLRVFVNILSVVGCLGFLVAIFPGSHGKRAFFGPCHPGGETPRPTPREAAKRLPPTFLKVVGRSKSKEVLPSAFYFSFFNREKSWDKNIGRLNKHCDYLH